MSLPKRRQFMGTTNSWFSYPETIDDEGMNVDGRRVYDEFGMELPTYLRIDLVEVEIDRAFADGVVRGQEAIRMTMLHQYGIDIDTPPEAPKERPRRVFWTDAHPVRPIKTYKGRRVSKRKA